MSSEDSELEFVDDHWWRANIGTYWFALESGRSLELYKPIGKPPELHVDAHDGIVTMEFVDPTPERVLNFIEVFRSTFKEVAPK